MGAPAPRPAAGSVVADVESGAGVPAAGAPVCVAGVPDCGPESALCGIETVDEMPVAMMLMQIAANATNNATASAIVLPRDCSGRLTGA